MKKHTSSVWFIIIVVTLLILASVTEILLVFRLTANQTMESGSYRLEVIGGQLEETISEAKIQTQKLAVDCQPYLDDRAALEKFIISRKKEIAAETGGVCFNAYIAGEGWYIIPDLIEPEGFDPNKRTWYIGAVRAGGLPYVTDPYVDVLTGNICYTVSVMLQDGETVVSLDYTMESIQQHIRRMYLDGSRDALIVTAEGIIAGCPNEKMVGKDLIQEMPEYAGIFSLAKSGEGVVTYRHGGNQLFATRSGFGWVLIVSENNWSLYHTPYLQMVAMLCLSLIVFAVVIVMYFISVRNAKKAEEAYAYKEAFLERITAELQEPLHRILSTASPEHLEQTADPGEAFEVIRNAGTKLSERIGKILSYSSLVRKETPGARRNLDEIRRGRRSRTIILAALMLVMGMSLYINITATMRYGRGRMQKEVSTYEYRLNEWINTQKSILDMFCSIISTHPEMLDDYEGTIEYLNEITRQYPEISVTYMTNPDLEHTVYMNNGWEPDENWHVEERDWYQDTLAAEEGWSISSPYYDEQTGLYCVTFSERVYDARTGEFLGNFGIDFYMDKLVAILGSSYTDTSYAFLADASGEIINHPYGKYQMTESGSTNVVELSYQAAEPDGETVSFLRDYDGSLRALIATRNEASHFTIYVVSGMLRIYGNVLLYGFTCLVAMIVCSVLVYRLMTGLIQLQEQANRKFRESADAAIAADAAKTTFLAQMSHEIRTPINAVLGMNEMILRESSEPAIREYAVTIQSSGKTLLSLINSILDFSKIEDGKMEILPAEYDTASMIHDLVSTIMPRAQEKQLSLHVEADSHLPAVLYGDDVRIRQVITNLLTNAVKYTEEGSITLVLRPERMDEKNMDLYVEVTDTGIGIREEDIGALFEPFRRIDEKRNRHIEGTGLGMTIVTNLLRMMRSELRVQSVYGQGSTFWFVLPQRIVDPEPMGDYAKRYTQTAVVPDENEAHLYAPGASVLVVDDNEMNLMVASHLMKLCGIRPDTALSGAQAIEMIREKSYQIVFLDHMMPKMDGIETLHSLQEEGLLGEHTTVIALTANAVAGARETYLAAGFQDYLSKPIESRLLDKLLAAYLPPQLVSYRQKSAPAAAPEQTPEPADAFNAQELRTILELCPDLHVLAGMHCCMDSRAFYLEILQEFLQTDKRDTLSKALADGDLYLYRVTVHGLKSTARMIGAQLLSDHAKTLEMAAKAEDQAFIREHHPPLLEEYAQLTEGIRSVLTYFGSETA